MALVCPDLRFRPIVRMGRAHGASLDARTPTDRAAFLTVVSRMNTLSRMNKYCAVAAAAFLGLSTEEGPAQPRPLALADLSGLSIESKVTRTEVFKRMNVANGDGHNGMGVFGLQIYVGNTGRLFSRQSYGSVYDDLHYDSVDNQSERLRYNEGMGFTLTNIDGTGANYVLVTTIVLHRNSEGQFTCNVDMKRVLKVGQKDYIKSVPNGDTLRIYSFTIDRRSCSVTHRNIFAN